MQFQWLPLPWVTLQGSDSSELALNVVLYVMTLLLVGSCLWLAHIAWVERD
jgi:hypothetical protein